MLHSSVAGRDREVLREVREGVRPKAIAKRLRLKLSQVYNAMRRFRNKTGRRKYDYLSLSAA